MFQDYKRPSSEIRAGEIDEQQEISTKITYQHIWLREKVQVPYDANWHLTYLGGSGLFFGGIATIMCGRVRNNNLAKFATTYKLSALMFGLAVGQYLHDDWQRTRWFYEDPDDI